MGLRTRPHTLDRRGVGGFGGVVAASTMVSGLLFTAGSGPSRARHARIDRGHMLILWVSWVTIDGQLDQEWSPFARISPYLRAYGCPGPFSATESCCCCCARCRDVLTMWKIRSAVQEEFCTCQILRGARSKPCLWRCPPLWVGKSTFYKNRKNGFDRELRRFRGGKLDQNFEPE